MNSLYLLLAAAVAFAFGYRFYAKLLALGVFRLDPDYITPAQALRDAREYDPCSRYVALGHHVAVLGAATTIAGTTVALLWGWIPAFLWVVVGAAVAGGTYGLGCLWLSLRHPGRGPGELAATLIGPRLRLPVMLLSLSLLLVTNAWLAVILAQTLVARPDAALPLWSLAAIAAVFGTRLGRAEGARLLTLSVLALVAALLAVWLFGDVAIAFTGALNLDLHGRSVLSLDALSTWIVLVFAYLYLATRVPPPRLARPRAFLSALLLAFALLVLIAAVLVERPVLVAPEFHTGAETRGALPWLFVTLTGGALAGLHLLIANGITARQLARETDARFVGYGGALIDGLVAVGAIAVVGTAFAGRPEWNEAYRALADLGDLGKMLLVYVDGYAKLAAALGMSLEWGRLFAAVVLTALIMATLEAGVRLQKQLLSDLGMQHRLAFLTAEKPLLWLAVAPAAVVALAWGGPGGTVFLASLGAATQVLAAIGLLAVTLALHAAGRPLQYTALPLAALVVLLAWALVEQSIVFWRADTGVAATVALLLLPFEAWILWEGWRAWKPAPATP